jgi:hypothetical protein
MSAASLPALASSATCYLCPSPGRPPVMTLAGTGRRLPPLLLQVRPEFSLQVHTELRPILTDGTYGAAQPLTARNALASTFGLIGAEYAPEVET